MRALAKYSNIEQETLHKIAFPLELVRVNGFTFQPRETLNTTEETLSKLKRTQIDKTKKPLKMRLEHQLNPWNQS